MKKLFNEIDFEFSLQAGAQAFVAIHTIVGGTSSGGMRIAEDLSKEEVHTLSREMTLKFSTFELGRGGAKSGIRIPPDITIEKRRCILKELGQRMAPIIRCGLYYPGTDMNSTHDDLRLIYESAGLSFGKITDSAYFTALSVANAIEVIRLEQNCRSPLRITIEGFGNVANHLASRLSKEHYQIIAVSTSKGTAKNDEGFSPMDLISTRKAHGDDCVFHLPGGLILDREALLGVETDILVPAARTWSIKRENVETVHAKWIVSAANAPCTDEATERLHSRGIVLLPGFVCNAGGVFGSTLFDSGISLDKIEENARTLYRGVVSALLNRATSSQNSPTCIAEKVALDRFSRIASKPQKSAQITSLLNWLHRRGSLPQNLYGRFRLHRFEETLRSLSREILEA